jgi:hypothetical protein
MNKHDPIKNEHRVGFRFLQITGEKIHKQSQAALAYERPMPSFIHNAHWSV